jgi:hypothetical protein
MDNFYAIVFLKIDSAGDNAKHIDKIIQESEKLVKILKK